MKILAALFDEEGRWQLKAGTASMYKFRCVLRYSHERSTGLRTRGTVSRTTT